MQKQLLFSILFIVGFFLNSYAQTVEEMVAAIEKEGTENSQLEELAYHLMDLNGPSLV